MIELIKLNSSDTDNAKLQRILNRTNGLNAEILARAESILHEIQTRGDAALLEFTERFDGVKLTPATLRVPREVIEELAAQVDDELIAAMRAAIHNIRTYHQHQLTRDWEIEGENGVRLGQRVSPLQIVGLYVPGGTAAYPSTVMMNAIPAQVAGVPRIVIVTPPGQFKQNPLIAATLKELGLFEVYTIGGAQAVAALAFGTATIPRVDKIVGPGNQYVAAAKKLVYGAVDIDSIAGPSEIIVVADDTARPDFVAADLLSQAEHSEDAAAILITPSETLALTVKEELARQTATLSRKAIIERSLADFGALIVVENIDAACALCSRLAPEHAEVITADCEADALKIHNAGAIFIGAYSPEPVGDYFAGTNHVLPTGGTARFSSALGVYDFLKKTSIVRYTREELMQTAGMIERLALAEGFDAHARSATLRIDS
ncbi:MAG: histidinol dehydrogenase [Acidobacteria bacterium]|nr:histidinol dehydrogenase [Acidobacteriota bacterium]MBI3426109.1 histidinol dehydrogenase [Acidobacteriota bacterium]